MQNAAIVYELVLNYDRDIIHHFLRNINCGNSSDSLSFLILYNLFLLIAVYFMYTSYLLMFNFQVQHALGLQHKTCQLGTYQINYFLLDKL